MLAVIYSCVEPMNQIQDAADRVQPKEGIRGLMTINELTGYTYNTLGVCVCRSLRIASSSIGTFFPVLLKYSRRQEDTSLRPADWSSHCQLSDKPTENRIHTI